MRVLGTPKQGSAFNGIRRQLHGADPTNPPLRLGLPHVLLTRRHGIRLSPQTPKTSSQRALSFPILGGIGRLQRLRPIRIAS